MEFRYILSIVLQWEPRYENIQLPERDITEPVYLRNVQQSSEGIRQFLLNRYCIDNNLPLKHIYSITNEDLENIYEQYYWNPIKASLFDKSIALALFDTSLLYGKKETYSLLSEFLGISIKPLNDDLPDDIYNEILRFNPLIFASALIGYRSKYLDFYLRKDPIRTKLYKSYINYYSYNRNKYILYHLDQFSKS